MFQKSHARRSFEIHRSLKISFVLCSEMKLEKKENKTWCLISQFCQDPVVRISFTLLNILIMSLCFEYRVRHFMPLCYRRT